jgi:hypothetical protein
MLIVVAIVSTLGERPALAVPYEWSIGQIQSLVDVTPAFHSGGAPQLSTIHGITPIPNGVELKVTYRIGQDSDPFGSDYGRTFARVSLQGDLGFPGVDASASTSSLFKVTTTTDITAQSFLQTDFTENGTTIDDGDANAGESFSFLFWEHVDEMATGGPTNVDFDFSSGTEFDGNGAGPNVWNGDNPKAVQGVNAIRNWGLQLAKFSGVAVGQPVAATIRIEGVVPEPGSAVLAGLAVLGLVGFARRIQAVAR